MDFTLTSFLNEMTQANCPMSVEGGIITTVCGDTLDVGDAQKELASLLLVNRELIELVHEIRGATTFDDGRSVMNLDGALQTKVRRLADRFPKPVAASKEAIMERRSLLMSKLDQGDGLLGFLNKQVAAWHGGEGMDFSLAGWLGLTPGEYLVFAMKPEDLPVMLASTN